MTAVVLQLNKTTIDDPNLGTNSPVQTIAQPNTIKKSDKDQQLVWGEVYVPNIPDSQGDVMTTESIQKMAYAFLAEGRVNEIGIEHVSDKGKATVVESFIARKDDPDFIEGSWVLGVHIPDPDNWELVKSGELNGFSLEGYGNKRTAIVELELPPLLKGETDLVASHKHMFTVQYGPGGEFVGGMTDTATDGHYHMIKTGTVTEDSEGHNHRFSFIEGILDAKVVS